ncbi:MAG: hypothetical protein WCS31_04420 [Verrucomicrobiae bacterium]
MFSDLRVGRCGVSDVVNEALPILGEVGDQAKASDCERDPR